MVRPAIAGRRHRPFGSLRTRLIISVACVHALMMSLFVADSIIRQRASLMGDQVARAMTIAHSLAIAATDWIAADDVAGLQELVDAELGYGDLRYAILVDAEGRILADSDRSKIGLYLLDLPKLVVETVLRSTDQIVDVAAPALVDGKLVGWARIGLSRGAISERMAEVTQAGILYALAAIGVGSLIAWALGVAVTRRLRLIKEKMARVMEGGERSRLPEGGDEETASLSREFDAMLDTLESRDRALRASEAQLRESQRVARIGSWDWDAVNDTIWWSREYYLIYGFDPNQAPPDYSGHLIAYTPESTALLDAAVKRAMEVGEGYELDLELAKPGGATKWIAARGEAKRDPQGHIIGLRGTAQDISFRKAAEEEIRRLNETLEARVAERMAETQRKSDELRESQAALMNIVNDLNAKTEELRAANEKLKDLDRLKSLFIASMSHELRTPLNSVIGFSSIMLNEWSGPLSEEQKENLAVILRSGKHLLALINDVIDVSKVEAGKVESFPEGFDSSDLVAEAVQTFEAEAKKKGLQIRREVEARAMYGDRRRLLQCLFNLVSNAVKYTDSGSIVVSAKASADASVMEFSVADTGVGIPAADLGRLFTPFTRIATQGRPLVPGTGLGLYLSKKLAQDILGGDIIVSSNYGEGSVFTLVLPLPAWRRPS